MGRAMARSPKRSVIGGRVTNSLQTEVAERDFKVVRRPFGSLTSALVFQRNGTTPGAGNALPGMIHGESGSG